MILGILINSLHIEITQTPLTPLVARAWHTNVAITSLKASSVGAERLGQRVNSDTRELPLILRRIG